MSKSEKVLIDFKQRVQFQKKQYGPGVVELDISKLAPHEVKFLHKMVEQGFAIEPKGKPVEVISEKERQARLAAKLLGEKRKPTGPNADANSLPEGSEPAEDEAQDESSDADQSSEEGAESDESEASEDEGEESSEDSEEGEESGEAESESPGKKKKKKKSRR